MQLVNYNQVVKIQPKGLVTIPSKLRKSLGFTENGLARLKSEKGRLIMEPVRTLPYPVRSYTNSELLEFIALDKKESQQLKKRGLL